jgi:hypothetical protein
MLAGVACGDPVSKSDASATAAATQTGTATAGATATPVASTPTAVADTPTLVAVTKTSLPPTAAAPTPPSVENATPKPRPATTRVTETFDKLPGPPWGNASEPGSTSTVADGVLTLYAPAGAFNEVTVQDSSYPNGAIPPDDVWDSDVSNSRGWWVEVRMRVDPVTDSQCVSDAARGPALTLWATDNTLKLVRLGFSSACVALIYSFNEAISVPLDTTSAFHVYRISVRLKHVDVFIDGALAIQHDYGPTEETTKGVLFGDGQSGYGPTRSYWDYITYDVSGPSP